MSAAVDLVHSPAPARGLRERARTLSWTRLLRGGSLAAIGAGLLGAVVIGEWQAIVTTALGLALGLAVVRLCFRGEDRIFLETTFLVAFGLRVLGAVVSHYALMQVGRRGFLLMDDFAYDKLGWGLVKVWTGQLPGVRDTDEYLLVNYTYLIAIVYYVLGHSLLAAKMLNVAFGAVTAVVVYALGAEIFHRRAARVAALLTAFFPSLLVWSIINLKDILVVFLTVSAIFGLVRYARRGEWWALALALVAFAGLENLRQFVFFILAWLMPIALLFTDRSDGPSGWRRSVLGLVLGLGVIKSLDSLFGFELLRQQMIFLPFALFLPVVLLCVGRARQRRKLALLLPLLVGVVAISYLTSNPRLGTNFLTPKALTEAEWKRWLEESKAQTGNDEFGGIKPPKDASDIVERSMTYLPRGVSYVLFGPTPWTANSATARAVAPEMVIWYGVLATAAAGLALTFRQKWRDLVLPLGFAAAWIVALALTEGNTGNIFRHRSQFMPFFFLLSAVGICWLWQRWGAERFDRLRGRSPYGVTA